MSWMLKIIKNQSILGFIFNAPLPLPPAQNLATHSNLLPVFSPFALDNKRHVGLVFLYSFSSHYSFSFDALFLFPPCPALDILQGFLH